MTQPAIQVDLTIHVLETSMLPHIRAQLLLLHLIPVHLMVHDERQLLLQLLLLLLLILILLLLLLQEIKDLIIVRLLLHIRYLLLILNMYKSTCNRFYWLLLLTDGATLT